MVGPPNVLGVVAHIEGSCISVVGPPNVLGIVAHIEGSWISRSKKKEAGSGEEGSVRLQQGTVCVVVCGMCVLNRLGVTHIQL